MNNINTYSASHSASEFERAIFDSSLSLSLLFPPSCSFTSPILLLQRSSLLRMSYRHANHKGVMRLWRTTGSCCNTVVLWSRRGYDDPPTENCLPAVATTVEWMKGLSQRAVQENRHSQACADYFQDALQGRPDLCAFVEKAKSLVGDTDPSRMTRYQQSQVTEELFRHSSTTTSKVLQGLHEEESGMKRFSTDGSPTGHNYWMEAGDFLASSEVPGFVKDEVLNDLRKDRPQDSPAFLEPEEDWAAYTPDYTEHLRKQKRRLVEGSETLF